MIFKSDKYLCELSDPPFFNCVTSPTEKPVGTIELRLIVDVNSYEKVQYSTVHCCKQSFLPSLRHLSSSCRSDVH